MRTVYLDNAASSWPKPDTVNKAMTEFNREIGANPGRSGHSMSIDAGRLVFSVREKIATLFGVPDPLGVVFTKNATEALNIASLGLLKSGDHAVVSGFEHNAIMRPLRFLEENGVMITVLPPSSDGGTDPDDLKKALRKETKAVYCLHASNVTGSVMQVEALSRIAHSQDVLFCVDASQSAGVLPIDIQAMGIDMLAFTGHKSLCGPQGTGGLVLRPGIEKILRPVLFGGTGSRSEYEIQPDFLPDMFEAGTLNSTGIAGLGAGLDFIAAKGIDVIGSHERKLTSRLIEGLSSIPGLKLHGRQSSAERIAVVSFTVDGMSPSALSFALDERYGIMTRPGLHCAPAAHKSIGTFNEGTVRMSLSFFTTEDEVRYAVESVAEIIAEG